MPAQEARSSSVLARLFCLVDTTDDLTLLPEMAALGVDGFQVRAKAASTRELLTATESTLATGACVVVNARHDRLVAAGRDPFNIRSEERRVGNECVSTCRLRWAPSPYKQKRASKQVAS